MDRHLAASLDHWLTTPPEHDEHECDDECSCAENDAELAAQEEAFAAYEAAMCKCGHERYHHGEVCLGITCRCDNFTEAPNGEQ